MSEFIFNNKESLLNIKPHYFQYILVILILSLSILLCSFTIDTYDIYDGKGYFICDGGCSITVNDVPENIGKISRIEYLILNNQKYIPTTINIGDIEADLNNRINYQSITYDGEFDNIYNKTIQKVKIFYNKERIFKKVIKAFLK